MNHLLLFENFYQPITQEYFSGRVFGNREKFTKDEIEKIAKIVPEYNLHIQCDRIRGMKSKYFDIVKLKDEWYFIIYKPATGPADTEREFYKCDQFEGLIAFLKKNINT